MAADSTSTTTADHDQVARKNSVQHSPLAMKHAGAAGAAADVAVSTSQNRSFFPLSYKDGLSQWWTSLSPAVTEHRVLSFIPYLQKAPTQTMTGKEAVSKQPTPERQTNANASKTSPSPVSSSSSSSSSLPSSSSTATTSALDPYGPRRWNSTLVELTGKSRALNEFSVERLGEDVDQNMVIVHGYGAGLGFFYKNMEPLSRRPGWKLYALDLLGMGRSSRPPFRLLAKDRQGKITEAENWFIDALEEWRIKRRLDRFTLVGHSLGGYLGVAYALKYPGRLNKLILASPVGIPEDPRAVRAEMPEPVDMTSPSSSSKTQQQQQQQQQPPRPPLSRWITYLWDANVSPFSIIRWTGPLGPRFVSGWTSRRFSHLPPDEARALHDYSYSLFRQPGSGEYALAYILAPGAFARSPLINRIQRVGRQPISPGFASATGPELRLDQGGPATADSGAREHGIPVVFMYGDHDWMDEKGGYAAAEKMREERERQLRGKDADARKHDNGDAKVIIIRNAGHHVYLDGADQFNQVMQDEMRDVEERGARESRLDCVC